MKKQEIYETIKRFIEQTKKSKKLLFEIADQNKSYLEACTTMKYLRSEWLQAEDIAKLTSKWKTLTKEQLNNNLNICELVLNHIEKEITRQLRKM
jgi:dTDP-glucose pyrophosphorylase